MSSDTDRWIEWHRAYEAPDSPLSARLAEVQRAIRAALDSAPPGPIQVISMCAGEARDLAGALAAHPRAGDVRGRVVELHPTLCERARAALPAAIDVVCGDASRTDAYAGAVPADLVLVCGVFGNITDADVANTIALLPTLCAPGATVFWTKHRRPPDTTPAARSAFATAGFDELWFASPGGYSFGVGVHRLRGDPMPFRPGVTLFDFIGYDRLAASCPGCGFTYGAQRIEIVAWLRSDARTFVERFGELDPETQRRRPQPDVWSPLEYACHVRDMLQVQRERIALILAVEEPELVAMGRDQRVIDDRYNEQDPDDVARALLDAANALADDLAALDDTAWERTAIYGYPTREVRTIEWIGDHTVHELYHHRRDIMR